MKITLNLRGWADSLTGNNKVRFAIECALINGGFWVGYDIQWDEYPFESRMVNRPWAFKVIAKTVTSQSYIDCECKSETVESVHFGFIAEQYSVPAIYEAALKTLKDKKYKTSKMEIKK